MDVELTFGPHGEWATKALIDTGSPITVFDRGAADALLVRIDNAGAEFGYVKILGGNRKVQFEYVDLCLLAEPGFQWTARVGFIVDPAFEMIFQGILGSEGFLDKWAVTFNKYYDYFILQSPDSAPY